MALRLGCAFGLLIFFSARVESANLLVQGGFEATPRADGLPVGWKASDFSVAGISLVAGTRIGGQGRQVLRIEGGGNGIFSELIPIRAGESVRFSGWLNSDDPTTPKSPIYVGLAWYDARRMPLSGGRSGRGNFLYVPMPKGTGWRFFETIISPNFARGKQVIPSGTAFVEARLFLLEYPRAVLFDDLELTQD